MTLHVPRLPFSLDPLIAEAKRRARRRHWLILFAVVVAAATAAAVFELRPASGSGPAAAGKRPVIHIVMEDPTTTVYFDLKTGRETGGRSREEMWIDQRANRERIAFTEGGRVVGDGLQKADPGRGTQAAWVNHFFVALVAGYRAALLNGTVRIVGRGTAFGHHLDWLRYVPPAHHSFRLPDEEAGVDARTYRSVAIRYPSGKRYEYEHILAAKAIRYEPGDFKRVTQPNRHGIPFQAAFGYAFGSPNPSASHSTVVRAPWLTAGPTVGGLELRTVTPFIIRKTKHRFSYGAPRPRAIRGLALVYATASHGVAPAVPSPVNVYGRPKDSLGMTHFTTVYEVPRSPRTFPWSRVPAGSIEVQSGYTTVGNHVVRTPWIGYLEKQGLFITITTPNGKRAPLQIARSLRADRK